MENWLYDENILKKLIDLKIKIDNKRINIKYDYFLLMKFLVANEFDINQTIISFMKYVFWRKEKNVASL